MSTLSELQNLLRKMGGMPTSGDNVDETIRKITRLYDSGGSDSNIFVITATCGEVLTDPLTNNKYREVVIDKSAEDTVGAYNAGKVLIFRAIFPGEYKDRIVYGYLNEDFYFYNMTLTFSIPSTRARRNECLSFMISIPVDTETPIWGIPNFDVYIPNTNDIALSYSARDVGSTLAINAMALGNVDGNLTFERIESDIPMGDSMQELFLGAMMAVESSPDNKITLAHYLDNNPILWQFGEHCYYETSRKRRPIVLDMDTHTSYGHVTMTVDSCMHEVNDQTDEIISITVNAHGCIGNDFIVSNGELTSAATYYVYLNCVVFPDSEPEAGDSYAIVMLTMEKRTAVIV